MFCPTKIQGQVTTATIYGNVTDASGAQVPAATVTIVNEQTGATQTATTNETGEFTFDFLPVGRYSLSIKASGFKEQNQPNIELTGGQRLRLSYALEIGALTEKVTVTADTPLINAVNAEQLISHNTTEVREMPLARRDWTNLLSIGTGVEVRSSGGGTGISLNGLPPGGFSLTVDGTQASASSEETSLSSFGNFNLIKVVSLEAISEVNVNKGIIPAEYANTLSGNVGLITRSGTNEYSGSLFENYQGRVLNARNQFLTTRPNEVFNQFGGSFGGPIIRNKLFFFTVYEGYRQRRFAAINSDVPTAEFRARATAAVPAYQQFFDTLPLPNQPYAAGARNGVFIGAGSHQANDDHLVFRGDYNINDSNRISSRYTRGRPDSLNPRVSPVNSRTFTGLDDSFTTSYFRTGASFSAETRFGFSSNDVTRLDEIYNLGIAGIEGFNFTSNAGEILASRGKNWSIEEIFALNRGRHSIKFGGLLQFQNQTRENAENPQVRYGNAAALFANNPNRIQLTFGLRPYVLKYWNNGYFIQDDFKVRPNLVVNLGLRYDYFPVPTEENDRLFNRGEPFGLGSFRPADSVYDADKNNFAPRVGFAWTVDKSARTVVRSGFGVFYTRSPIRGFLNLVRNAVDEPFRVIFSLAEARALRLNYPVTNDRVLPLVRNPNAPWVGDAFNTKNPTPYSMQWVLSLQRQLTNSISVDTAYVGTRGVKLRYNRRINLVDRQTGLRPFSGFGEFAYFDTSESTTYHAWQTNFQKRLTQGFLVNANYTWSRAISYGEGNVSTLEEPQDANNLQLERGPSPYDITHRFASDFLYELPFARWWNADGLGKRLLFAGWQVSGIFRAETGAPFNIAMPNSLPGQRVDYVGGSAYIDSSSDALNFLNRSAFAQVPVIAASGASARPGTLGRNALRLPGYWNIDLTLAKNFALNERLRLQLRGDLFNAFNHTSFSSVNTTITSGNFGRFTATRGARVVQLNMRFSF
ncbi:MAG: carboxypeptidase regulatory-like domain-containing protein [Pyrinomonadaceae bacterium]|nr:carboxypeptidase regulatory-like domain-containing protein [Pyrinomonadaceae bacterium]